MKQFQTTSKIIGSHLLDSESKDEMKEHVRPIRQFTLIFMLKGCGYITDGSHETIPNKLTFSNIMVKNA